MYMYLVLLHHSLTLIILITVLVLCGIILRRKSVRQKATPTLMLFFYYLIGYCSTGCCYRGYLIAFWGPIQTGYNQQTLYLAGILHWLLIMSNPIFEIFLCIERCFAVALPLRYTPRWKQFICLGAIATFIISTVIYSYLANLAKIPDSRPTDCLLIICVTNSYAIEYRVISSLIELILAIILLIMMKWKSLSYAHGKKINKAILIIIFTSMILDFGPYILGYLYQKLTGDLLPNVLGPYHTTTGAFSILISVVSYFNVFYEPRYSEMLKKWFQCSQKVDNDPGVTWIAIDSP